MFFDTFSVNSSPAKPVQHRRPSVVLANFMTTSEDRATMYEVVKLAKFGDTRKFLVIALSNSHVSMSDVHVGVCFVRLGLEFNAGIDDTASANSFSSVLTHGFEISSRSACQPVSCFLGRTLADFPAAGNIATRLLWGLMVQRHILLEARLACIPFLESLRAAKRLYLEDETPFDLALVPEQTFFFMLESDTECNGDRGDAWATEPTEKVEHHCHCFNTPVHFLPCACSKRENCADVPSRQEQVLLRGANDLDARHTGVAEGQRVIRPTVDVATQVATSHVPTRHVSIQRDRRRAHQAHSFCLRCGAHVCSSCSAQCQLPSSTFHQRLLSALPPQRLLCMLHLRSSLGSPRSPSPQWARFACASLLYWPAPVISSLAASLRCDRAQNVDV